MSLQDINDQEKIWLLEEKYAGIESDEYHNECQMIDEGMPVAYIIGNIEFLGCCIDLTSKPLIPRAETEYWVHKLIQDYKERYSAGELRKLKVLDVFAGSGCIGIAIRKHFECHVDFAELKPEHCKQIQKNIDNNFKNDNSHIFESNVLENVPSGKYDLILANPPYVPYSHKDALVQESVNNYEDQDAVYAEDNGNELIKRLLNTCGEYLGDESSLFIEFDPSQTQELQRFASESYQTTVIKDQFQKDRVIKIKAK